MRNLILILIIITVIVLALCTFSLNINKIKIREIPNVENWMSSPYDMPVVIRCYIINNPPADYSELRKIAEKHIDDNWDNIVSSDDHVLTNYKCLFYRKSERLPWNWKEDTSYFADRIEDHTNDMIISVRWTVQDIVRDYTIMKKGDGDDNYGSLLEAVYYKGDQLVDINGK